MPKGYRLAIFAIGLAAVIGGWYAFQPQLRDLDRASEQGTNNAEQQQGHDHNSVVCEADCQVTFRAKEFSAAPDGGQKTSDSQAGKEEATREMYDLLAQERMAYWTVLIALFTGAGIVLLYQTLSATRETVDQMKDANEAAWEAVNTSKTLGEHQIQVAERAADEQREVAETVHAAFLVLTEIWAETWLPDSEKLRIGFKNIGQSPAFNIRFSAKTYALHASDFFRSQEISSLTTFNNFLAQLEDDSFALGFERQRFLSGAKGAVDVGVFGVILWDDIFGNPRGIRFNYNANVPPIGPINKFYNDWFGNHILSKWQVRKIDNLYTGQKFDLDLEEDEEE